VPPRVTRQSRPAQWIENLRLPDGRPPRLDMYGHDPFSLHAPNLSNPPSLDRQIDFSDSSCLVILTIVSIMAASKLLL
jgi:hypothetical protein